MKRIILVFVLAPFVSGAFAQQQKAEPKTVAPKKEVRAVVYCCSKCDHCSSTAGQCPVHKTDMIKDGAYYCPMHENEMSDKEGKCARCGMNLKKMDKMGHKKEEKKTVPAGKE